jgi:hypothetical protein
MGASGRWRSSQLKIALGVLALHLAIVALLLMHTRSPRAIDAAPTIAVQIVILPPTEAPHAMANSVHLKRLKVDMGIALSPPTLDASSLPPPSSGGYGDGPGVNWTAEARRAVSAFEIRRDQHVTHAEFGQSPWEGWLPQQEHRAGDKLRTDNGDWIVWVDANCYQVAKWYGGVPLQPASSARTFCLPKGNQ